MSQTKGSFFKALSVVLLFCLITCFNSFADETKEMKEAEIIDVGAPGPEAIEVEAKFLEPEKGFFKKGDRVAIELKPKMDAHIIGVFFSPNGDVMVFFPNPESPSTLVKGSETLTLFGPDSKAELRLSDKTEGAKLSFYISSAPVDLKSLETKESDPFFVIHKGEKDKLKVLESALKGMASDKSFNIMVVNFPDISKKKLRGTPKGAPLKLMGPPPAPSDSAKPVGVSGVAGKTEKKLKPSKE